MYVSATNRCFYSKYTEYSKVKDTFLCVSGAFSWIKNIDPSPSFRLKKIEIYVK